MFGLFSGSYGHSNNKTASKTQARFGLQVRCIPRIPQDQLINSSTWTVYGHEDSEAKLKKNYKEIFYMMVICDEAGCHLRIVYRKQVQTMMQSS